MILSPALSIIGVNGFIAFAKGEFISSKVANSESLFDTPDAFSASLAAAPLAVAKANAGPTVCAPVLIESTNSWVAGDAATPCIFAPKRPRFRLSGLDDCIRPSADLGVRKASLYISS